MNKELQILADWFLANKLNISQRKCMLFYRSPPNESEELILTMYNNPTYVVCKMSRSSH